MRKGEINALKWSDIEGDTIHVRRSIAQKLKGTDRETPPKNKSSYRDLQMPKPLVEILGDHKKRQQSADGFTEDWRVCGGIQCLRDTSLDVKNRAFAKMAGLPTSVSTISGIRTLPCWRTKGLTFRRSHDDWDIQKLK